MTQDEIEFLIVQRLDGTLSAEDDARLTAMLAVDASARELLASHEALNAALQSMPGIGAIDESWLSAQIAARIDEDQDATEQSHSLRLPRWSFWMPMAMAASLLLGLTIGGVLLRDEAGPTVAERTPPHTISPTDIDRPMLAQISGPTAERAESPRLASVSVGAPANLTPALVTALFVADFRTADAGHVIVRPAGYATDHVFD